MDAAIDMKRTLIWHGTLIFRLKTFMLLSMNRIPYLWTMNKGIMYFTNI